MAYRLIYSTPLRGEYLGYSGTESVVRSMMVVEGSFWVMISVARLIHFLQASMTALSLVATIVPVFVNAASGLITSSISQGQSFLVAKSAISVFNLPLLDTGLSSSHSAPATRISFRNSPISSTAGMVSVTLR